MYFHRIICGYMKLYTLYRIIVWIVNEFNSLNSSCASLNEQNKQAKWQIIDIYYISSLITIQIHEDVTSNDWQTQWGLINNVAASFHHIEPYWNHTCVSTRINHIFKACDNKKQTEFVLGSENIIVCNVFTWIIFFFLQTISW